MHALLNIAVRAARRAGEVIVRSLNRLESLTVTSKGRNDFVSEVDHAGRGARSSRSSASTTRTTPFSPRKAAQRRQRNRLDHRSARWHDELPARVPRVLRSRSPASTRAGWSTRSSTTPCARRSSPPRAAAAHTSTTAVSASANSAVSKARSIATGFPYRANTRYIDAYLAMLQRRDGDAAGVRRPGSAALDLAYVAAGRVDAFWEIGLAPWDTAAGTLLIQEAGGRIGTLGGGEYTQGGTYRRRHAEGLRGAARGLRARTFRRSCARLKLPGQQLRARRVPRFPQGACVEFPHKIRGCHGVTSFSRPSPLTSCSAGSLRATN